MAEHDLTGRPVGAAADASIQGLGNTAAELARIGCVDTGAMTRMLDRLEAKGLVRRSRCPKDGRVVQLELTGRRRSGLCQRDSVRLGAGAEFAAARLHRSRSRDLQVACAAGCSPTPNRADATCGSIVAREGMPGASFLASRWPTLPLRRAALRQHGPQPRRRRRADRRRIARRDGRRASNGRATDWWRRYGDRAARCS